MPSIESKYLAGLPAQYFDVLEPVLLAMKEFMEKEGRLQPFAYLGCSGSMEITMLQISTDTHLAKIESAKQITRKAKLVNADFVAIAMESYFLPPDKADQHDGLVEEFGSLAECPYAIPVVSFSVETESTLWLATFPIKPKGRSKTKKTFAAPKVTDFTGFGEASGIFVALLPGSRLHDPTVGEPRTLH